MSVIVLLFADKASDVVSGAVLTLVLPLGLTFVAFLAWYAAFRRRRGE